MTKKIKMVNHNKLLTNTIAFVKDELKNAEGGHDWFHVDRVYKNALLICKEEKADVLVVSLAALLHDIADSKFFGGDESVGPKKASDFLESQNVLKEVINHVIQIIKHVSFKNSFDKNNEHFSSKELEIVQDADRLDAIGAIGIARCFNFGGFKNNAIYNPKILPNLNFTKESYKKYNTPTLNHFYEKLLLLKDKMNTQTGKKIAKKRHTFMELFLEQFHEECNGKQ